MSEKKNELSFIFPKSLPEIFAAIEVLLKLCHYLSEIIVVTELFNMPTISKEKTGADSEEDYSSKTSVASKPEEYDNKQPRAEGKGSDTTSTTNDPSYTSAATASVAKVVARHPASQSGLPTLPAAAAAAAPPVSRGEKKPRRAGFREQFLQQVRSKSISP